MPDQNLSCRDCKQPFVFTEGEQKFFTERQFTPPTRCKSCRQARKAAKEAGENSTPGTFNPVGGYSTNEPPPQDGGGRRHSGGRGRRRNDDHGSYGD